jgi:signal transduction histidine kinase
MSPTRRFSLRSTLGWITGAVVAVALVVSAALIAMTTVIRRATASAATAVESVRLAEKAENDVLLLGRTGDPVVRRALEGALRRRLADAAAFVSTTPEGAVLATAVEQVEAYLIDLHADAPAAIQVAHQEAAYAALEAFAAINVAQSDAARAASARWDQLGDVLGISAAAILLLLGAALYLRLRRGAFEPLFSLADVMRRFREGRLDARAEVAGAAEFEEIARGFNEMAATLERQRQRQLAFLAAIAHDLRNPLQALRTTGELLPADAPLPPEDKIRQALARIQRQVDRLDRMVADFLDAAGIEAGQLELHLEDADLREVVDATVDLFAPTSRLHRIVVAAPPGGVRLTCDPTRLEQVLNNLVSNAIKYSPAGGAVRVALDREGPRVRLSVTDEGVGIAADELERVFEPFRRAGATRDAIPGVGLGLCVARRIVEAHGGELRVASVPGAGSTFTIELAAPTTNAPAASA